MGSVHGDEIEVGEIGTVVLRFPECNLSHSVRRKERAP